MQIWEMSRLQKNKLLTYLMYEKYKETYRNFNGGANNPSIPTFEQWVENIVEEE